MFQDKTLKTEFLKEYDKNIEKYEQSCLKELWDKTKYFNPDKIIFTNTLYEVSQKLNPKINDLSGVVLKHNVEKQVNEKLTFWGIFHAGEDMILNDDILQKLREILESTTPEIYHITMKHILDVVKT